MPLKNNGKFCCFLQFLFRLMRENEFCREQVSNMIAGLTFYQLWYSTIPKEMLLIDSDHVYTHDQTNKLLSYLEGWNRANSNQAGTCFQCDSDSHIKNERVLPTDFDSGL